jgi:hypothetical protein
MTAALTFLSSVQPATAAAGPEVSVELTVAKDRTPEVVTVPLRLYGPGHCLGIDPRQIIRTDPPRGAGDADPTRLVAAEFDAPELPWLLSPGPVQGRSIPWICLAVMRAAHVRLSQPPHLPLPVLDILEQSEIAQLPDPATAWAWAHAQVVGRPDDVDAALKSHPERTLARLLGARRLADGEAYVACVVPLLEAGRLAGLQQDATRAGAAAAWSAATRAPLRLPVYYSWEFSTRSATATFAGLANRLRPGNAQRLGRRRVFVGGAGHPLPPMPRDAPGAYLGFDGALAPAPVAPDPWAPEPTSRFADAYARMFESESSAVGPPMYGRAQASVPFRAPRAAWPRWLRELNTDPRYRAAAALGARVVQRDQEQLVAAAWAQAAQLRAANTVVRHGELAAQVALTIFDRRLRHVPGQALLQITAPAHGRVRLDEAPPLIAGVAAGRTLRGRIVASSFPTAAATTSFRRVIGGGGIGRRVTGATIDTMVQRFAAASLRMPVAQTPRGTVRLDQVSHAVGLGDRLLARASQAEVLGASGAIGWRMLDELNRDVVFEPLAVPADRAESVEPAAEPSVRMLARRQPEVGDVAEPQGPRRVRLNAANLRFQDAAEAHQAYLDRIAAPHPAIAETAAPALSLDSVRAALVGTQPGDAAALLHPSRTVTPQVRARVTTPTAGAPSAASPAPVLFAPTFPQPMAAALRELGEDLILPGVGEMTPDTAILLAPNARFIEAFMVGLNDELTRELVWRGFPVDPHATCFNRFWDARSTVSAPAADIRPIDSWPDGAALGQNMTSVARTVLVIRGDLARAHGTVTVYAVAATASGDLGSSVAYPVFRTPLSADVLAIGFDLAHAVLVGNPGWYFVFEEQASEPVFDARVLEAPLPSNAAMLADAALRKSQRIAIHAATLVAQGQ